MTIFTFVYFLVLVAHKLRNCNESRFVFTEINLHKLTEF
jgi:hypothetical protein